MRERFFECCYRFSLFLIMKNDNGISSYNGLKYAALICQILPIFMQLQLMFVHLC